MAGPPSIAPSEFECNRRSRRGFPGRQEGESRCAVEGRGGARTRAPHGPDEPAVGGDWRCRRRVGAKQLQVGGGIALARVLAQKAQHVVERAILEHQDDDVLDCGQLLSSHESSFAAASPESAEDGRGSCRWLGYPPIKVPSAVRAPLRGDPYGYSSWSATASGLIVGLPAAANLAAGQ